MNIIKVRNLKKTFGDREILKDISFDINENEVVSIIGPSGSGKSTLLRCLNLLETCDSGTIDYHGKDILHKEMPVEKYRAKVGMVFQQFNLFNNLTVLENCMIAQVSVLNKDKSEAKETALKYLKKLIWINILMLNLINYQEVKNKELQLHVLYQ